MARRAKGEPTQLELPLKRSWQRERVAEANEEALLLAEPELDEAIIGTVDLWMPVEDGQSGMHHLEVALYDREKVIEILMKGGLSYEDAVGHYDFNVTGGCYSPHQPAFASLFASRA